jgi:hypothetical protein
MFWSIDSVQTAAQPQIGHYGDRIYWLDNSSMICIVGKNLFVTLKSGQIDDN